jgi:hypothetical protein
MTTAEWIEREVAKRLAEREARQDARNRIVQSRNQRWENKLARRADNQVKKRAAREHLCGARTRTGAPCRRKGHGAGGRCPNHGGMSTGPRTKAGRERIAQAQRQRWAEQRALT